MRAIEFQYDLLRKNKLPGVQTSACAQNPLILQLREKRFIKLGSIANNLMATFGMCAHVFLFDHIRN